VRSYSRFLPSDRLGAQPRPASLQGLGLRRCDSPMSSRLSRTFELFMLSAISILWELDELAVDFRHPCYVCAGF
jgi:hypothetical protein